MSSQAPHSYEATNIPRRLHELEGALLEAAGRRGGRAVSEGMARAWFLGACGVMAAAAAVGAAIGSVHHVAMAVRHLEVFGVRLSYPVFNGAELLLLGLAGLGAAAVTVAVRACWRQRAAYRDFL